MSEKFSFENFINHLPAIVLSAVHENSCNFMLLPLLLAAYFCAAQPFFFYVGLYLNDKL